MTANNPTDDQPQGETPEMPERIYIPHGPAMLMAVSPELQNNEGAWYNLETDDGDLRSRILALKTPCQGELPAMYNKAIDDAVEIVGTTKPREDAAISARNRDEAQQVVLDTEAALEEKFDSIARHELVNRITATLDTRRAAVAGPRGDVEKRRLDITLGYIKRAANRELPKLPCRVDEMTEREVAIFNVGTAAVGNLQFIARELDALPDAATASPTKCTHCQHGINDFNAVTGLCEFDPEPENESVEFCGCKCEFAAAPEGTRVAGEHPEDFCKKCNRPNIVWFAPNELWNKAVRAAGEPEILCPVCFVQLAQSAGVNAVWRVAPQGDTSLNQTTLNTIQRAAQEVVDIAYRDRGQIPHRDTIVATFSKHFAAAPADNDAESLLTDREAKLVIGAMPMQSLPGDVELVVERIRNAVIALSDVEHGDPLLSRKAVLEAIDAAAATKGDR